LLLDRSVESEKDFERACTVLAKLDDVSEPRPAEVEFALLLRYHLDKPWNWELLRKALELRRVAELAAVGLEAGGLKPGTTAYSEQVHRWIKADVLKGDQARVLGQDLLFATSKGVKGPADYLNEAAEAYQQVQSRANPVREALAVRDRAFAE